LPVFTEPIDVVRRRYLFQHPEYHSTHEQKGVPRSRVFPCVDPVRLALARDTAIEEGKPAQPLPILKHKILTTPDAKEDLAQLEQYYLSDAASCRCYKEEKTQWDEDFDFVEIGRRWRWAHRFMTVDSLDEEDD
jgi:hypothetical protein